MSADVMDHADELESRVRALLAADDAISAAINRLLMVRGFADAATFRELTTMALAQAFCVGAQYIVEKGTI